MVPCQSMILLVAALGVIPDGVQGAVGDAMFQVHGTQALKQSFDRPKLRKARSGAVFLDCSFDMAQKKKHNKDSNYRPGHWGCKDPLDFQNDKKTIFCIGDSITEGLKVPVANTYPAQLFDNLHAEFNVVNLAIPGSTMGFVPKFWYQQFPNWGVALANKFDIAIIQLGTNDGFFISHWNNTRYEETYTSMVSRLLESSPNATIIFSIPPPVLNPNPLGYDPSVVNEQVPELIRSIQRKLELKNSAVVDMQAAIGAFQEQYVRENGKEKALTIDGVHLTRAGYNILGRAAAAAVRVHEGLPSEERQVYYGRRMKRDNSTGPGKMRNIFRALFH